MASRPIPQRELRNNVGAILREAESGETFTITVRGKPVAQLGPLPATAPRTDVDRQTIRRILAMPIDSADLTAELDAAEAPVDEPRAAE